MTIKVEPAVRINFSIGGTTPKGKAPELSVQTYRIDDEPVIEISTVKSDGIRSKVEFTEEEWLSTQRAVREALHTISALRDTTEKINKQEEENL